MKRSQLKRGQVPLKKTTLQKQSSKAKVKQIERAALHSLDAAFYNEIWEEKFHKSDLTGRWLGNESLTSFFHHLLPKEMYPQFRHKKWNILVCEISFHNQIETKPTNLPEDIYDVYIDFLNRAKEKAGLL